MGEIRKTGEPAGPMGVVYDFPQGRRRVTTDAAPASDEAAIGEGAREANRVLHVVEEAPEIRAGLVAELRAQIASGDYQPNAREIAREILNRGL